jgi:acyl-CoA dehydrogenase
MGTPQESPDLFDLRMSEEARPLMKRVTQFLEEVVAPMQEEYFRLAETREDHWGFAPGQLDLLDEAKAKAKEAGLWNFFLPDSEVGGLSNLDYAYIAVKGRRPEGLPEVRCARAFARLRPNSNPGSPELVSSGARAPRAASSGCRPN